MNNLKNKRRAIVVTNQMLRSIEPLLAKMIKERLKLNVLYLAKTKEDKNFYKKHYNTFFDEIEYLDKNVDVADTSNLSELDNVEKTAILIEKK